MAQKKLCNRRKWLAATSKDVERRDQKLQIEAELAQQAKIKDKQLNYTDTR